MSNKIYRCRNCKKCFVDFLIADENMCPIFKCGGVLELSFDTDDI